ncbi:MAG: protease complex subunit PrcB family protein, partial [Acidobacteriota bacterium]|nr:protease complex subunit PrcB family protein [Acidobacteriota bacterium]
PRDDRPGSGLPRGRPAGREAELVAWIAVLLAAVLQSTPAPVETVVRESSSGVEEARQAVVNSAGEWTTLWREHAGHRPPPSVDFNTRTVLAIFLGSRPSAGYAVEIVGTRTDASGLVVEWRERAPERGMVAAQVMTSPGHIVSVPKVTGPVRFEKAVK